MSWIRKPLKLKVSLGEATAFQIPNAVLVKNRFPHFKNGNGEVWILAASSTSPRGALLAVGKATPDFPGREIPADRGVGVRTLETLLNCRHSEAFSFFGPCYLWTKHTGHDLIPEEQPKLCGYISSNFSSESEYFLCSLPFSFLPLPSFVFCVFLREVLMEIYIDHSPELTVLYENSLVYVLPSWLTQPCVTLTQV